jgi:hypothetical protein
VGREKGEPCFNIVVSGEGFTAKDQKAFRAAAANLIGGLKRIRPFSGLGRRLNWYVVRAVSARRFRIENGPDMAPGKRSTFFEIRAGENELDGPAFAEMPQKHLLEQAMALGNNRRADLLVILVNCRFRGGRGWAELGTALVTLDHLPSGRKLTVFHYLAAHECAHAISNLADEDPHGDSRFDYRANQATLGQVSASVHRRLWQTRKDLRPELKTWKTRDSIWWKKLTPSMDKDSRHRFIYTHTPADKVDPNDGDPLPARAYPKALGAFWGCGTALKRADLETRVARVLKGVRGGARTKLAGALIQLSEDGETGGGYFYRPSARCCMRSNDRPFCPVCAHVIANHIRRACRERAKKPACGP